MIAIRGHELTNLREVGTPEALSIYPYLATRPRNADPRHELVVQARRLALPEGNVLPWIAVRIANTEQELGNARGHEAARGQEQPPRGHSPEAHTVSDRPQAEGTMNRAQPERGSQPPRNPGRGQGVA